MAHEQSGTQSIPLCLERGPSIKVRSTYRAAASTRVLEYYSSSKLFEQFFTTRVLVNFYLRLQISISGCSFFAVQTAVNN